MLEIPELKEDSPRAKQPDKIKLKMKCHQLTALNKAHNLETMDNFNVYEHTIETILGIIGDKVGSGKSLMVLSIIAKQRTLKKELGIYRSDGYVNISYKSNEKIFIDTNMILVPHGLIKQWENYIVNDTDLTYIIINTKKTIKPVIDDINILNNYDVTLVSSTKYNELADLLNPREMFSDVRKVSRIFIDETDSIKIPSFRRVFASFYWFISSSYSNLFHPDGLIRYQNKETGEISRYYNYHMGFYNKIIINGIASRGFLIDTLRKLSKINPCISENFVIKNSDEFINLSFNLPEPKVEIIKCRNPVSINVLSNIINNDIISFINAGDIDGAIDKLNLKKVKENNLLKTVTEDFDISIKNKEIELEMKSKMTYSSESSKKKVLDRIKEKIDELVDKKNTLKQRLTDNKICPICYDEIENCTIPDCCKGSFCFKCLSLWLSNHKNCPLCRQEIIAENLIVISDEEDKKDKPPNELLFKIDQLKQLIVKKKNNSKILIFSEYDNSFCKIENILKDNGLTYSKIMGQGTHINNTIKKFKSKENDKIDVLLLNSTYFGSGLNLENATDIIIYHNMTKELTSQIIGRAQRPGRTTQLNIYALCNEAEIPNCSILNNIS